ncbi:hypothetical protein VM1G_10187 [Cytospora mali]|uniref:HNH nuclease domain-containing protein n=1 Tax=Cytospora mali TaxID=578113 RepID=A0A194WDI8_CYTMA|nr:hypothetical protein VM1G_10187 [Valsa mali]
MSGISRPQRQRSWNVRIYIKDSQFAGVYQRNDQLSIADIAYELDLCFIFDTHEGWQQALLPRGTASHSIIILDRQDRLPFPTPDTVRDYDFIFHSSSLCAHGDLHSLSDPCVQRAKMPMLRVDPRYLEIGKQSQDERLSTAPLRRIAGLKRRSTSISSLSQSATSSPLRTSRDEPILSPTRTSGDEPIPQTIIEQSYARSLINSFRSDTLANSSTCVITGKGKLWFDSGNAGPGIEVAHIIPQIHWNTYPLDPDLYDGRQMANPDDASELKSSWEATWDVRNALTMKNDLHRCFDARLLSIHPETHIIRAFVNYDIITDFHGQKAKIPSTVDSRALRHHWDMCCLENSKSHSVSYRPGVRTNVPGPPRPSLDNDVPQGDPSKNGLAPATDTPATDTPATNAPATNITATVTLAASGATAHPPSPPPSEPPSEGLVRGRIRDVWLLMTSKVETANT